MKLRISTAAALSAIVAVLALGTAQSAAADVTAHSAQQAATTAPVVQSSLNWD
ncbi:hypothetical protein ABT084_04940 [Streptomyces sp. NPDC002138]|uniref:hypothetical protein n=1 Tax=Streptomyces sp. NPDC002138 TaxID=3154410 RepID=UPI0033277FC1